MRLGLFVTCFLVAWVAVHFGFTPAARDETANLFWVALLALVLSAPLSWVLLRRQRDAMSEQIVARVDRAKAALADNRAQEDGVDDVGAVDDTTRAQGTA
jgi:Co/Zn/Cd efflux system component